MIEVVVAGAAGRMGGRIIALVKEAADFRLVGALERSGHPALGRDPGELAGVGKTDVSLSADPTGVLIRDRVLVEFTTPEATLEHLRVAARVRARAVVGTTGFSKAEHSEIATLARELPIVLAPNMSVGVNLMLKVLAELAPALGDDYDVEITEIHHRGKKDSPSGTALKMGEVIAQALGRDLSQVVVHGRHGMTGERTKQEIGILSLRAGDVVGEHTVVFGGLGERIEITHRAASRDTFARGALRAARFVTQAAPGLYSMQDVLGLR